MVVLLIESVVVLEGYIKRVGIIIWYSTVRNVLFSVGLYWFFVFYFWLCIVLERFIFFFALFDRWES